MVANWSPCSCCFSCCLLDYQLEVAGVIVNYEVRSRGRDLGSGICGGVYDVLAFHTFRPSIKTP